MNLKFYPLVQKLLLAVCLFAFANNVNAQNQGLYADTVMWTNANTISVNVKTKNFSNVVNFQGTVKWDKNSLQFASQIANSSVFPSANFLFGSAANAQTNGNLSYIYSNASGNHTVPDGTIAFTITFNVINNPAATYDDNSIQFVNMPTSLGIDTAADVSGLSDYGSLTFPNSERHTSGLVSFARPPFLIYDNTTNSVYDTITNRPAGSTYQWTLNTLPVAGTDIGHYNNSGLGLVCLTIIYPNNNTVSCSNVGGGVLPVKWLSFDGKAVENKVNLVWKTANELNNKGFYVEKSENGREFNQVGFVAANSSMTYSFTDAYAYKTVWYRLKQVDVNGSYSYSKTIQISANSKDLINIYPNPAKSSVNIEGNKIQKVIVTNVFGKTISAANYDGLNIVKLNIASLSSGVYYVTVVDNTATQTIKLVVE